MKTKKSKNVAYQVFVEGDSSLRPQHLAFNQAWYRVLWMVCPAISLSVAAAAIHKGANIGFVWEIWFVPPLFRFNEIWSPPDNDEAYKVKGFRGWYWTPFSRKFKHRSLWSHTLTLGTPLRFCIAYWLPILLFVLGWNWQVLATFDTSLVKNFGYWLSFLSEFVFPLWAAIFIGYWYGACMLSDLAHLILDRYLPHQWIVGKK